MKPTLRFIYALCFLLVCMWSSAQTASDTLIKLHYVESVDEFIENFDPAHVGTNTDAEVTYNLYESLYGFDKESTDNLVPLLATEHSASEDGLVHTYKLREGVTFHSGNPFSCKDVEYSLERILVIYSGLTFYVGISLLGEDFDNADGYVTSLAEEAGVDTSSDDWETDSWEGAEAGYAAYWQMVDTSVTCVDDYTVQFNLPKPDPSFFVKMATYPTAIVDSEYAKANGEWDGTEATYRDWIDADPAFLDENVSGTGPYKFVNYDGENVFAEVFEGYWGEAPALSKVQYSIAKDLDAAALTLQNGDADIVEMSGEWTFLEAKLRGSEGITVHENPEWQLAEMAVIAFNQDINTEDGNEFVGSGALDGAGIPADFFSDINVRKAFAYSFDPDEFIASTDGRASQRTMAIPPFVPGYNPDLPVYTFDAEKAEEAFRAAWDGQLWETGFQLSIATYSPLIELEILKANIESLNDKFRLDIVTLAEDEFFTLREEGKLPIINVNWYMDYPRADNLLYDLYYTGTEGNYNGFTNYVDEELNELLDGALNAPSEDQAAALYAQVGQHIYDTVPTFNTPLNDVFLISRDNLQGIYFNPVLLGRHYWKDLSKN
ncbi:MAG: ABC transporter substrate-binding protein [Trueperaceae bacterium]